MLNPLVGELKGDDVPVFFKTKLSPHQVSLSDVLASLEFTDRAPRFIAIVGMQPVSMSLGIWMTLLTYLISIPLGIRKAVADGSQFDVWTSGVIIVGYAIPSFLFAILLVVLFAGGSFRS